MDKRHYKKIFSEFNFGRTIEIRRGDILYVGFIDTYRATQHFVDFDECLNRCREIVDDMPDWLVKTIGH